MIDGRRSASWPPPAITDSPAVVLADAGYWHGEQIDELMGRGVQVLIPPDADKRRGTRPGWDGGRYAFMRRVLDSRAGRRALPPAPADDRAGLRRHQVQPPRRPLLTPRPSRRPLGMATDHRHRQPPQALAAQHRARGGLTRARRRAAAQAHRARNPHPNDPAERPRPFATASMDRSRSARRRALRTDAGEAGPPLAWI